MKHLIIDEYGTFLGLESGRITVKQGDTSKSYPLNRLRTLNINKSGVGISSNLIQALSFRGVKCFFTDFKGTPYAQLIPSNHHCVVALRQHQMNFCASPQTVPLANLLIRGKILNQRATLLYYSKYKGHPEQSLQLRQTAAYLAEIVKQLGNLNNQKLLGIEGIAASAYFQCLKNTLLKGTSFLYREGRNSQEIVNQMLNYGYGILHNQVLNCVYNAGLEPYLGVLHQPRPGKPALSLDIMEEYRAWVVDRAVLKNRHLAATPSLNADIRKKLVIQIMDTLQARHAYRKKRLELNYIIQRQVYRLCGHLANKQNYRPFLFKW